MPALPHRADGVNDVSGLQLPAGGGYGVPRGKRALLGDDLLAFLPDGPCKAALMMLADYSITRHE